MRLSDVDGGVDKFNRGLYGAAIIDFTQALQRSPDSASILLFRSQAFKMAGDNAGALRDINQAKVLEPSSPMVRFGAAGILKDLGKRAEALKECEKAVRFDPQSAAAYELKSELEWGLGFKKQALRSLGKAIVLEPRCGSLRLKAAQRFRDLGRSTAALKEYASVVRLDPASAATYEMKSDLESSLGRKAAAWRSLERAIALEPGVFKLRMKAAKLLLDSGNLRAALKQCRAGTRLEPKSSQARKFQRELESVLGLGGAPEKSFKPRTSVELAPGSFPFHMEAARIALDHGDFKRAMKHCQRAIRSNPQSPEARVRAASILQGMGKFKDALTWCAGAIRIDAKSAIAYEKKHEIELSLELKADSWQSLSKAMALAPRSAQLHAKAAEVLKEMGYLKSALKQCRAAIRLDPRLVIAYQKQCSIQIKSQLKKQALGSLRKALALASRSAPVSVWAAGIFKEIGDYQSAFYYLKAAIRFDPDFLPAYAELGQLSLWLGDAAQAVLNADKALRLNPKFWVAFRIRGAAAILQGRYERGIRELDAAIALFPGNRRRLTRLRYIVRHGDYMRPLDPADCESHVWRGEAFRRLGRYSSAKADIKKALMLTAQSVGALTNQALIEISLTGAVSESLFRLIKIHFPKPINASLGQLAPTAESLEVLLKFMGGNRTSTITFLADAPGKARLRQHVDYFHSDDQLELQERIQHGDVEGVMKEFDYHMRERPHDAYMLSARGETCSWIGRYRQALRDLKRSLVMNPILAWPDIGICSAYVAMGQYRRALAHLDLADKKMVPVQLMVRWRGEIYRRMGDYEKALQEFKKSSEIFPYKPSYWINLALTQGALGKFKEQREIFLQLQKHIPGFLSDASDEAGVGGRRNPDNGEIAKVLEKALELMKGNRSSWMYTYVLESGQVKHIKIKPLKANKVPSVFVNHSAAFLRYFVLNKNS